MNLKFFDFYTESTTYCELANDWVAVGWRVVGSGRVGGGEYGGWWWWGSGGG